MGDDWFCGGNLRLRYAHQQAVAGKRTTRAGPWIGNGRAHLGGYFVWFSPCSAFQRSQYRSVGNLWRQFVHRRSVFVWMGGPSTAKLFPRWVDTIQPLTASILYHRKRWISWLRRRRRLGSCRFLIVPDTVSSR